MSELRHLLQTIGRKNITDRIGCTTAAVTNAIAKDELPPSWYPTIQRLAFDAGIVVPEGYYRWANMTDLPYITKKRRSL